MSIASAITAAQAKVAAAYSKCNDKGATMPAAADQNLSHLSATIDTISGGGGGGNPTALENDVNFIDYDGTIRYSYSTAEFANLSALPANPTHAGLTAQGWNWSLAGAKSFVATNGGLTIGQNYVTEDGKTRFYITVPTDSYALTLTISCEGTIDWGDGNTQSISQLNVRPIYHTYSVAGDYTIVIDGEITIASYSWYNLFGDPDETETRYILKYARIGANAAIQSAGFSYCEALRNVTLPNGYSAALSSCFRACKSLSALVFPNTNGVTYSVTTFTDTYTLMRIATSEAMATTALFQDSTTQNRLLGIELRGDYTPSQTARNAPGLTRAIIAEGITAIGNYVFSITGISSLTIPSTVTSIGNSFCTTSYALGKIIAKPTTPPSLGSTCFSVLAPNCKIYVPNGCLSAYKSATNWSTHASKMVEMPA